MKISVKIVSIYLSLLMLFIVEMVNAMPPRGDYRIMFYNVENLFDVIDDEATDDDDFTPEGKVHWNYNAYRQKINRIAQVIVAVGQGEIPDMVGLCEVENKRVLRDLVNHPLLRRHHYEIIHFDSPDVRGIDVALLYKNMAFELLSSKPIPVTFEDPKERKTRDILYAKCINHMKDTLHVFVNHWSSKYGGVLETVHKRQKAARILRYHTDSLFYGSKDANVLVLGDLNTTVDSGILTKELGVDNVYEISCKEGLYNLSYIWNTLPYGTYKHKGVWQSIDHIIVSRGLLCSKPLYTSLQDVHIFYIPFLLEKDNEGGFKPFRTHIGLRNNNGFSDHLPIFIDLWRDEKKSRR